MNKIQETLSSLSTEELMTIAEEMNMEFIPEKSKLRDLVLDIALLRNESSFLVHILGLAPLIALELSKRLQAFKGMGV